MKLPGQATLQISVSQERPCLNCDALFLTRQAPFALPASLQKENGKIIAPACTVKMVSKHSKPDTTPPAENLVPKGSHWVDLTEPGSIVVIEQPEGQSCAAVGGIMAQRMKVRGVVGCVVGGRVRDLAELRSSELPVCEQRI